MRFVAYHIHPFLLAKLACSPPMCSCAVRADIWLKLDLVEGRMRAQEARTSSICATLGTYSDDIDESNDNVITITILIMVRIHCDHIIITTTTIYS